MMTAQEELGKLRPELRYFRIHFPQIKKAQVFQKDRADKLEQENRKLKEELKKVKEELEKIKKQRDTYKGMIFKAKVQQKENASTKKKPGGQIGHIGASRKVPEKVDQRVRVYLKFCPSCHKPLKRSDTFETQTVEDIPNLESIKTVVTEYKKERQWCETCHKEVVGKPGLVIPSSRLGLNLVIQILVFKYVCRMSLEVLVETLYQTYGVSITEGAVINLLKRTKKYLAGDYSKLLKAIRSSPIKHADETGWRIKGVNGYLWAFLTEHEVYYTIEKTRGGGVARAVLEDSNPEDVLVRDDYSGYKNLALNQQSCWAHLLRVSREEANQPKSSKEVQNLHFTLKNMYQDLLKEVNTPFDLSLRQDLYLKYSLNLEKLAGIKFRSKAAKRVQTRIKNQGNNLLTALLHEGVPLTNNLAERTIRPCVVIRKISGGSRSDKGAETFATNFSVIQTIRMRHQPLIPTLTHLLTGKL